MVSWTCAAGVVIETEDHPQDAGPFARPFLIGFDKCPEYRPMVYLSSHPAYGQMKENVDCQHLQTGPFNPGGTTRNAVLLHQLGACKRPSDVDPHRH
jgi:hypothetical protein